MKIESSAKPTGASFVKETRGHSAAKATASTGDDVQLSAASTQLSGADDEQAFDASRVSEIKQAISEGRFTINAGAIADRLITSAKELVNSQRQA